MRRVNRLALVLILLKSTVSWGIDLQPNDIVAPQPWKHAATLSYFNSEYSDFYRNGSKVSTRPYGSPTLSSSSAILRVATTYQMDDYIGVSYIQLPYGTVKPGGSLASYPADTGTGDLTLATAMWPYANRKTRTYFAVAGYLTSPTSSYSSNQAFNLGENRFKSDIQMGFQRPIIDNVDGMIAVDTMWFGGNSQCALACASNTNVSLTQKPLTTTQLGPIYTINPTFTVAASYFYVAGGATSFNNRYQNNVVNTQRYLLSAQAHYPIGRFSLQYGRDMEIKNGFFQSRVLAIRFLTTF